MGRLDGKVAFITGAARGQGRSHAVRMAEEGADIIAVDIDEQLETVPYELSTMSDLEETARLVQEAGRRVFIRQADVRSLEQLEAALEAGVAELGRLDAVVANAGIWSYDALVDMSEQKYLEMIDVNQNGVFRTCKAAVPRLLEQGEGGTITIISSAAGRKGLPSLSHYSTAKHAIVGLMRSLANELAPHSIRVNTIHPCAVRTKMIQNDALLELFAPGVENPVFEDAGDAFRRINLLPIPWVEPIDISHAVVYLSSDESRYVTGVSLSIDAGQNEKL
jgi:(+)-trans-carveol dehydrogenase